jgi:hypothetical protein
MPEEITVGKHVLALEPVSLPRAQRGIRRAFEQTQGGSFTGQSVGQFLTQLTGPALYDLLCALIPGLKARMPLWEFSGYKSQDAMDADEYDEDADDAPSSAEVVDALEAAWRVGKLGRWLRPLGQALDTRALQAVVTGLIEDGAKASLTTLPSPSSESPLTSGSSTPAKVSRSNGSKRSSQAVASI